MKLAGKRPAAVAAATTCALVLGSGAGAWAADVPGSTATTVDTAVWTPPSPDPSGIAFLGDGKFIISDAEVEEIREPQPGAYKGANLFTMTSAGALLSTGTTVTSGTIAAPGSTWSAEPVGLAFGGGKLYVADDDKKAVFIVSSAGTDGKWGTTDDPAPTSFKTSGFNNSDPEGVAYDSKRKELLLVNGQTGARFYRLNAGINGVFNGGGDDIIAEYDLTRYGLADPEGIAYDASRDTIVVSDDGTKKLYELDHNGALLNTVNLASVSFQNLGDVTWAPSSSGTGNSYWLVDRGLDNNSHPDENDGKVIEVKANLGAITNFPPVANAGVDQLIDIGETVSLNGAGVDSDAGDVLTYQWSVTGPAGSTVSMATPTAASTTASGFSTVGDYAFTLTVRDGKGGVGTDSATVRVFNPGDARNVSIPIATSTDDAQESRAGADLDYVEANSADNELGNNLTGGTTLVPVQTGFRFLGLPVPKGAEIVSAKIQFKVDEAGTGPANFTINGQADDNALTFVQGRNKNISTRPRTAASVPWSPPEWAAPGGDGGEAGPGQLTPDLKAVLQEIVDRPGWARGNAAAFFIQGSGRRTAEAKDGLTPPVLLLEFKTPVANKAPVVNAGADTSVTMPNAANLDGTVTDDGLPKPPAAVTTKWAKVTGPGTVTFGNDALVDTTATFSAAGVYTLRLTANDGGAPAVSDDVQVTVNAAQEPDETHVSASMRDATVMVGSTVRISGTVSPAAGQLVQLQSWRDGAWVHLRTVQVGSTGGEAPFSFSTTSTRSGAVRYRVHVPATDGMPAGATPTMKAEYYQAAVTGVSAKREWVKITNTGAVALNLRGWTLRNTRNGKVATLEAMLVRPGRTIRVHSGAGRDDGNDMYLGRKPMWGKRGKAVLTDDVRRLAYRFRY